MSEQLMVSRKQRLSPDQYLQTRHEKRQIYLHHTVSGNAASALSWWRQTRERIGTAYIIDREGAVMEVFEPEAWAFHLGVKGRQELDQHSIGIELVCWGRLQAGANGYIVPDVNREVHWSDAVVYSERWHGDTTWQRYTQQQMTSLRLLLLDLCDRFKVPTDYKAEMWTLNEDAITGKPGIWTHVSVRRDKSDCHPQPELIELLQGLSK